MRIKAKIEISNRSLAVHNMSGRKGKDAQALLAIGKKPKGLVQSTLKESNKVLKCFSNSLYSNILFLGLRFYEELTHQIISYFRKTKKLVIQKSSLW